MLTRTRAQEIRENTMFHALMYGRHDPAPMKKPRSPAGSTQDSNRPETAPVSPASPRPSRSRKARPTSDPSRQSLTPQTWIDAATEVLVDRGIDHVRVDVLATELGVTRGSFYWHFRDREDLLRQVLQAWRFRATNELTSRLKQDGRDATTQLRDVISLPHRGRAAARAARIELAIRAWARRDPVARGALDEADAIRIDYHRQIFEALGFATQEARLRAFVLYSCEVAESLLRGQGGREPEHQVRQDFLAALMQTPLRDEIKRRDP